MSKKTEKTRLHVLQDILQAHVPGYDSMRPAICNLSGLNIPVKFEDGEILHIEAVVFMGYITLHGKQRAWVGLDSLEPKEFEAVVHACQLAKYMDGVDGTHRFRAINPWWFIGGNSANESMDKMLGMSEDDYLKFINDNPKNNKEE